jgi:hypothetical protein
MPEKRSATQVKPRPGSSNGTGFDHLATAETAAPERDLPSEETVTQALSDDPLDLSKMRVNPAKLTAIVGLKAAHIRVGRPDDQDFFRVHDSPLFSLDTYLLRMKADREFYFVASDLWDNPKVLKELKLYRLYYYVHLSRALGLWPVQLPDEAGNQNAWHESAMHVAEQAKDGWLRLLAGAGGYSIIPGDEVEDEPVWPAMTFQEVIRTAFRPKTIADLEHPKLKQLWGKSTAKTPTAKAPFA